MALKRQHIILLIINIIGGAAVIGSYIYGLGGQDGGANVLWGGVPENVRPVYFVSMILSALGYFAFLSFLLFRVKPGEARVGNIFGFGIFYLVFIGMLGFSVFWMPLTNVYVGSPSPGLWAGIRAILWLVGLSSLGLSWALLKLRPGNTGVFYKLAVAGSLYFSFHTVILDAITWTALFK